jgi:glycosyltransferase involved in cell wall biosynthesis
MTPITDYDVVTLHDIGFRDSYINSPTYKQIAQYYGQFFIFKKFLQFKNIIVLTNILKNKITDDYKYKGNVFVVPHFYSPFFKEIKNKLDLRKFLKLPIDRKLILSVSTDKPNKNLQILSKVFSILGNEYKLVRVGPSLMDSITFNNVNNKHLNYIYNACDAMVNTSLDEGFGYPIIEAFATGLPVVASDIPIFHEIGGNAPIYVNNRDPEHIARGIIYAVKNKEEVSKNSLERAKIYTINNFTGKMLNVYSNII